MANVELITQDLIHIKGSCCDNGRFIFKDCGSWWYNCENWGASNYTTWIQYSEYGFSMPLGTEHKGRCQYFPEKRTCPIPEDCSKRSPKTRQEVCQEIPNREIAWGYDWKP